MTLGMNLFDGIVAFTKVVNCGGFSAAAKATGHSTSYISKEINKLETRLGVRLLNRTTRSISLTPEGKVYFQQCEQMVSDAEGILGELDNNKLHPKGLLKISCPVSFGLNYLQPILSEFMHLYPDINLELDLNDRQVDVVQDGFDLVVRASAQLDESSLICRKIMSSKAHIIASKAYVSKHGKPEHPRELEQHQCICYSNLAAPTKWPFSGSGEQDFSIDVTANILCNSAQMELAMVLADHGICRLPEFAIKELMGSDKIECLFTDFDPVIIDVFAVYPSKKHLSPKIRLLIDLLVSRLS